MGFHPKNTVHKMGRPKNIGVHSTGYSLLQYLQSQSKGTNTRYLTMGILNSLAFIVPPKELQDEFTSLVAQVDKSKFEVQRSLEEAQKLFDSLMQEYFS